MCSTAEPTTSAIASFQARCLRRASPSESQISRIPNARASTRAASGTPGGSTPRTRRERSANSGVRAEAMPIAPAMKAPNASTAGAEKRCLITTIEGTSAFGGPGLRRR